MNGIKAEPLSFFQEKNSPLKSILPRRFLEKEKRSGKMRLD
jgi:hypothetical protein